MEKTDWKSDTRDTDYMYVCMYLHTYTYARNRTLTDIHTRIHTYIFIHMYTHNICIHTTAGRTQMERTEWKSDTSATARLPLALAPLANKVIITQVKYVYTYIYMIHISI